ncbi:MAG: carbohydrate binding family 9 domain-containing protein [Flavobacteriales bacterium]|nr:carbohydrate binding family 9 domain-containing protein [Flavobacteriales bacterium]
MNAAVAWAQQPTTFPPPETPHVVPCALLTDGIKVDGDLRETAWASGRMNAAFVQKDPQQGAPPSQRTDVFVLHDAHAIYVGVFCYDSAAATSKPRVISLQRDFEPFENDFFSVAIDGIGDHRNAWIFQATPYGNQRDLQVLNGDNFNEDWNALWHVATTRTDSGWCAEFAIPWKSLRYRKGATEMGILFARGIRRNNEFVTFPAIPRAYTLFRMEYAARLTGITPPNPSLSLQLNPYALVNGPVNSTAPWAAQVGGELKWAPSSSTVIDATVNTDFAQTDVDQQVNNLGRFSIFFPEKRQFFLENAALFDATGTSQIVPFYSRRIGLDDNGIAQPLDAGLRVVTQTAKHNLGAIAVRERGGELTGPAHYGVLRYAYNPTAKSRFGALVTMKDAQRGSAIPAAEAPLHSRNYSATADVFLRPTGDWTIAAMGSATSDDAAGTGGAAHLWLGHNANWGYAGWVQQYVDARYTPGSGFVMGNNYLLSSPAFDLDLRPKWLPKKIRSYVPFMYLNIYHDADDLEFQQADIDISLTGIKFQNGTYIGVGREQEWQRIPEGFAPLGVPIAPGDYSFGRTWIYLSTDGSRKISGDGNAKTGRFYDGGYWTFSANVRYAPIPHVRLGAGWSVDGFERIGITDTTFSAHLLNGNVRIAPFARLQITGSYQYNTVTESEVLNARLAWEYRPLSFLYLVFGQGGFIASENRNEQRLIGKVTWLKQL